MKIKVKTLDRVSDAVIRQCSLMGLILDTNTGFTWIDGILYKVGEI